MAVRDHLVSNYGFACSAHLSSQAVREKWIETLIRAREYLNANDAGLPEKANGRKREFRYLEKALLAYVEE